jgi:hypothetical protein
LFNFIDVFKYKVIFSKMDFTMIKREFGNLLIILAFFKFCFFMTLMDMGKKLPDSGDYYAAILSLNAVIWLISFFMDSLFLIAFPYFLTCPCPCRRNNEQTPLLPTQNV